MTTTPFLSTIPPKSPTEALNACILPLLGFAGAGWYVINPSGFLFTGHVTILLFALILLGYTPTGGKM